MPGHGRYSGARGALLFGTVLLCLLSLTNAFQIASGRQSFLALKKNSWTCRTKSRGALNLLVSQFQLPDWMPKFGGIAMPVAEPPAPSSPPPPPPRLPMLKEKLIKACDEARKGVAGTGSMSKEEFDALVEEICSLNPTPDPAVRWMLNHLCTQLHVWASETLQEISLNFYWHLSRLYQDIF
jgi:hypothetical protein